MDAMDNAAYRDQCFVQLHQPNTVAIYDSEWDRAEEFGIAPDSVLIVWTVDVPPHSTLPNGTIIRTPRESAISVARHILNRLDGEG